MKLQHVFSSDQPTYDPFQTLAVSVIRQASMEYRRFGSRLNKSNSQMKLRNTEEQTRSISRFFLGGWYCVLNGDKNGSRILEILDREVIRDD